MSSAGTPLVADGSVQGLTPRQFEILALIAKGLSNREVCDLLGISSNTVKVHVAAILKALDVTNRTEAATEYQRLLANGSSNAVAADRIGRPMIAVLPFANLSSTDDSDYLAGGLVEDLITRLSGWRWFPVIASLSSSRFGPEGGDLTRLRDELGAGYAITGSVRRAGDRLRVSAHVLDTTTGTGVWSGAFDAELDNLISTQDEIARRIVAHLAPELMETEGVVSAEPQPGFDAWRRTMRGMWHLARRTSEDVRQAIELFRSALTGIESFSLAAYGLTWAHHHNLIEQWTDDPAAEFAALNDAAEACMRADPQGAPAHTVAGLVEMFKGNTSRAVLHLEKSASLNPSSTQTLSLLGQCYGLSGRPDECIAMLEDALKLNPFAPSVWIYQGVIALAHFAAGRAQESVTWSRVALDGRPQMVTAHLTLCAALVEQGDVDGARTVIDDILALRPGYSLQDFLNLIAPAARPEYVERFRSALAAAGMPGSEPG